MKSIYGMFFSATGTTAKIVSTIAAPIGQKLDIGCHLYDFTKPSARIERIRFSKDDIVVLGVPVMAGRVPNLLLKYLGSLKGESTLAVPVVVFGNRHYDDALIELRDIMTRNAFIPVAAGAFVGEHSFSSILGQGRPDARDISLAYDFADRIAIKINTSGKAFPIVNVKGNYPYRPYYQPSDAEGRIVDFKSIKPETNDMCILCGLCAQICPLGSIDPANLKQKPAKCMKCCACVKKCTAGAKSFDDPAFIFHRRELENLCSVRSEPEIFT